MLNTIPIFFVLAVATAATTGRGGFNDAQQNNLLVTVSDDSQLATYCSDPSVDGVLLPFLNLSKFDGSLKTLDVPVRTCGQARKLDNGFHTCPSAMEAIQLCQAQNKKVFGVLQGLKGFRTDAQAQDFAENVWNMFGHGVSENRVFGPVSLDGFIVNTDAELNSDQKGWAPFLQSLQERFEKDKHKKKKYYTGALFSCEGKTTPQDLVKLNTDLYITKPVKAGAASCNTATSLKNGLLVAGVEAKGTNAMQDAKALSSCNFAGIAISNGSFSDFKEFKAQLPHDATCRGNSGSNELPPSSPAPQLVTKTVYTTVTIADGRVSVMQTAIVTPGPDNANGA